MFVKKKVFDVEISKSETTEQIKQMKQTSSYTTSKGMDLK
jgi:hypothetical protein